MPASDSLRRYHHLAIRRANPALLLYTLLHVRMYVRIYHSYTLMPSIWNAITSPNPCIRTVLGIVICTRPAQNTLRWTSSRPRQYQHRNATAGVDKLRLKTQLKVKTLFKETVKLPDVLR